MLSEIVSDKCIIISLRPFKYSKTHENRTGISVSKELLIIEEEKWGLKIRLIFREFWF